MPLFQPTRVRERLTDISPELVRELGCTAIAIDADNTSSYDKTTEPLPGTPEWMQQMKDAGIPVLLLSNAKASRAGILADRYGIPVVGLSCKPLPTGYLRAAFKLKTRPKHLLVLGDQLFTDILGANLTGCPCVWVQPYGPDNQTKLAFAVKRALEEVYRRKLKKNGTWKELTQ